VFEKLSGNDQVEILKILKKLCNLFIDLEFKFESVLFEELKNQMICVYLKREAVDALANEFDILISKNNRFQKSQDLKSKSSQPSELIENLKLESRNGLAKRVQGGIIRLDSK
jgi:hypothetical protein